MNNVIATIGRETIEEFICRHRGGVFTNDVAGRFGMIGEKALLKLKEMERAGTIYSERESASGGFVGAGLVWRWGVKTP